MTTRAGAHEQIRALATVTLDAQALDELGPETIDLLSDLVAKRLAERQAAGEAPLLKTIAVAEIAGVHPDTARRAIRSGSLRVAGYVGQRPRMRREDGDAWIAANEARWTADEPVQSRPRRRRPDRKAPAHPRVLGDAMHTIVGVER